MSTNGPKIAAIQKERSEISKKIYVVVGQLSAFERGHSLLSEETKRRLELELLQLEHQNTNLAADECLLAQQDMRQVQLRHTQTRLF